MEKSKVDFPQLLLIFSALAALTIYLPSSCKFCIQNAFLAAAGFVLSILIVCSYKTRHFEVFSYYLHAYAATTCFLLLAEMAMFRHFCFLCLFYDTSIISSFFFRKRPYEISYALLTIAALSAAGVLTLLKISSIF